MQNFLQQAHAGYDRCSPRGAAKKRCQQFERLRSLIRASSKAQGASERGDQPQALMASSPQTRSAAHWDGRIGRALPKTKNSGVRKGRDDMPTFMDTLGTIPTSHALYNAAGIAATASAFLFILLIILEAFH